MPGGSSPTRHFTVFRVVAATLLVGVLTGGFFVALTFHKDFTYYESEPYERAADGPADVLVVYYSRSGHTETMAREIARRFDADVVRITTEAYSRDFEGWNEARRDATERASAEISPATVDLSRYELIFVGSPIWMYRPSPPLWTFVEANDFHGRPVVLFNTFNSRFKDEHIEEFEQLVQTSNGRFLDHVYVRRGRIYYQLSGEELIAETRLRLDEREADWRRAMAGD